MKTILVPIDFSDVSGKVVDTAGNSPMMANSPVPMPKPPQASARMTSATLNVENDVPVSVVVSGRQMSRELKRIGPFRWDCRMNSGAASSGDGDYR